MKIKAKILFTLSIFVGLTACHSAKITPHTPFADEVAFLPAEEIPFPATQFDFLFPRDTLEDLKPYNKDITDYFTSTDVNQIAVRDPKLFSDGNTEIIDFSLIPEGDYAFPLPNGKVISPYGGRRRHHSGTDIKTCANDTIVAAFDGIVRMAKPYAAYGNVVVLRHYNGLETIYSHNSKNLVKPGDRVKAGEAIALTGRTGRATTEHLHFETRINGHHFNPNVLFDMERRELRKKCLVCTLNKGSVSVQTVDLFPHQQMGDYDRFAKTENEDEYSPKTLEN